MSGSDLSTSGLTVPGLLAGYRVRRVVSLGLTGTVVEASSIVRGRDVRVRVLRPEGATRPEFAATWVRAALSATLIDDPNVARVVEVAGLHSTWFVATEADLAPTLAERLASGWAPSAREAIAIVLHTARGLRVVRKQGLGGHSPGLDGVRIDGWGLVRVDESAMLPVPTAGGTLNPSEEVSQLGTILFLLTGGSPSEEHGSANEEPGRVQDPIRDLSKRMKREDESNGFPSLDAAITGMEEFLGIPSSEVFLPRQEQAEVVEQAANTLFEAASVRRRARMTWGFFCGLGLLTLITGLVGWLVLAAGLAGFGLLTALADLTVRGFARRTTLTQRLRELILGARREDLLTGVGLGLLIAGVLAVTGLLHVVVLFGMAAVVLAIAAERTFGRAVEEERRKPLGEVGHLVTELRGHGVAEVALRRFVYRFGGQNTEELYEALFGYDGMRAARRQWSGVDGAPVPRKFAAWRDPAADWITKRLIEREDQRRRDLLATVEERRLCAEGENLLTARRKARRIAAALTTVTLEFRQAARSGQPSGGQTLEETLRAASEAPEEVLLAQKSEILTGTEPRSRGLVDAVLGRRFRLLAGSVMLAGFLVWLHQNGRIPDVELRDLAERAVMVKDWEGARKIGEAAIEIPTELHGPTTALRIEGIPSRVTGLVDGYGAGVAALILLLFALRDGSRASLFAIPAAVLAIAGDRLGIPGVGLLGPEALSMLLAGVTAMIGWSLVRQPSH